MANLSFATADGDDASALVAAVADAEREMGGEPLRLYHLAIPPSAFTGAVAMLGATGLAARARIIVEKPFGHDLVSAKELNAAVHAVFPERDVFRIDHFLGKESVENILALRFANGLFEPIWNRDHVDHVQIDVPETLTVAGRSGFYESTGAFRDMVVTHLFQVLGFIAMEPPTSLAERAVRDETSKVFDSVKPLDPSRVVRGQYEGYRSEEGVDPASETETFVALAVEIDNWRWAGVPFFLRTGKSLAESCQAITLAFREPPLRMFQLAGDSPGDSRPNELVIDFKDPGSISAFFLAKEPGPDVRLREVAMTFNYDSAFGQRELEGYERLVHDAMLGDQTLFTRGDGIERLWDVAAPLLDDPPELLSYAPGSWGPAEARGADRTAALASLGRQGDAVMSDRAWQALITAIAGLVLVIVLRVVLGIVFDRYVDRMAKTKPADYVARLRTRLMVLRRVILVFVVVVVIWSVLEIFPSTEQIARTLIASSAFIALVIGVAFSVPLGNIGAGILLSLTQPVRIGDRISVGDVTGTAEEITLIHTVVRTDQGLTAFVPNSQMITSTVVNRSLEDPRRLVSVRVPIALGASVDDARAVLARIAADLSEPKLDDVSVFVSDVGETRTWLTVSGYAPRPTVVDRAAAELRERALAALAAEDLLPRS